MASKRSLMRRQVAEDAAGSELGDSRRVERLVALTEALGARPSDSFPDVFDGAGLEALYRFCGKGAAAYDLQDIIEGHVDATMARAKKETCPVLVLHDTTDFCFGVNTKRRGLGRMNSAKHGEGASGFFLHLSLVVTGDGQRRALGVGAVKTWVRTDDEESEKESVRWGELVQGTEGLFGTKVIHVMDREGDDFTLFALLARRDLRYVIRMQHPDRRLAGELEQHLHDALERIRESSRRTVYVSARTGRVPPRTAKIHPRRGEREAELCIGATTVDFARPRAVRKSSGAPDSMRLNVVRVWEPHPPAGVEPVEWVLLTREPVETVEQLWTVVEFYRARWVIEEYFKALKSHCKIKERQLESYTGLTNMLGIFLPIAWGILALRQEARERPFALASTFLSADELAVLRRFARKPLPRAPTSRDAFLAIAGLGGHLKRNGDPGWLTLGRGYERLQDLALGWSAARAKQ